MVHCCAASFEPTILGRNERFRGLLSPFGVADFLPTLGNLQGGCVRRMLAAYSGAHSRLEGQVNEFRDIQAFVRAANYEASLEGLAPLVEDLGRALGFDYVGLTHHVDFKDRPTGTVSFGNYPASWVEMLLERRYYADDPVHVACQRAMIGFRWTELPRLIDMTPKRAEVLENAHREGVADGFTVPVHIPGELHGSSSFAIRRGREFPEHMIPAAQAAGCFAFEAARRIAKLGFQKEGPPGSALTPRQLDCLVLVGQGKSDTDTAQLLGLSRDTVHQHIETAKHRLNVASRQQLVARALFDGLITFRDILH